jgi:thiol-disulfide isomerase/thioredoxin
VIYTEDNHEELYRLRIRYYLSASDLIPRRIESIAIRDDRVSMTVARLTSVKLNDTIDERAFDPAIQADYREELFSDRSTDSQTKEPVLPEWSLSDAQGKPCSLTDFRGSVVVMDFWGIWCNGCVKSLPKLQALHEEWSGKGVAILGMSYGDEPDDVVNFAEQKGLTYPQVIASTSLLDSLRIDVFPSIVIVDASGRLDRVIKGSGDESHQAVVTRIRELVQDQAHSR